VAIFALAGVAISATVLLMLSRSKLQKRRTRGRIPEVSDDSNDETLTIGDTTGELPDSPMKQGKSKVKKEDVAEVIDDNDLLNDMYLLGEIHPQQDDGLLAFADFCRLF
jgi:hypothetical protein